MVEESKIGKDRQKEKYKQMGYKEDIISALVQDSGENYDEVFREELKKLGIDISVDGLKKAIDENCYEEEGYGEVRYVLRIPMEVITTGYILDSISSRDKTKIVDSTEIARASADKKITTGEVDAVRATTIGIEPGKDKGDAPKGEG